jgi:hypothetical protein
LLEYTAYVSGFPYSGSPQRTFGVSTKKRSRR